MEKYIELKRSIALRKSPEIRKKEMATHVVNTGILCGNGCAYCATPELNQTHKFFKANRTTSFNYFNLGIPIIDPDTPRRLGKEVHKLTEKDTIYLSSLIDPYGFGSDQINLGRQCLEVILKFSSCKVRILTKNSAVHSDLQLLAKYPMRVEFGMPITAPVKKENLVKMIEPRTAMLSARLAIMKKAQGLGIPVYGMVGPCLPGLIDNKADVRDIFDSLLSLNPEDIFIDTMDLKWNNFDNCKEAFESQREYDLADSINKDTYMDYVYDLIDIITGEAKKQKCLRKVKIFVHDDGFGFLGDDRAVIWLDRK